MRKDLQHLKLNNKISQNGNLDSNSESFASEIGFAFKSYYSEKDIENLEHLNFAAGFPPYLRGISASMYVQESWSLNQATIFFNPLDNNAFFQKNMLTGQKAFSLVFDPVTRIGFDSNSKMALRDSLSQGVALDSVEDMIQLFHQIPLDQISISIPVEGPVLAIVAFYIVAAQEQGVALHKLSGSFQFEILNNILVQNSLIYPQNPSNKILKDIAEFTRKEMPQFNTIALSTHAFQEFCTDTVVELAFILAEGKERLKTAIAAGETIDEIASRLSFSFSIGLNHFVAIAKMRAARMLWSKIVKPFGPKNQKSMALRLNCQTSKAGLSNHDSYDSVTRTTIELLSAIFGGGQSLQSNLIPESKRQSIDWSQRMTNSIYGYLKEETKIAQTIDPYAGSYYIESLTHEIAQKVFALIEEIEGIGGMTQALSSGFLKSIIEEVQSSKNKKHNNCKEKILEDSLFSYEKDSTKNDLDINKQSAIKQKIEQLELVKSNRDDEKVNEILNKLSYCASTTEDNLLEITIEAARSRATLGEICEALKSVYGKFKL